MRTYGKRPAAKLREHKRQEHGTSDKEPTTSTARPTSSVLKSADNVSTNTSAESEKAPPAKRLKSNQGRSILSYYKPVPAAPLSIAPQEEKVASPEPVSPRREAAQANTKRRRRLRIRPTEPSSPSTKKKPAEPTNRSAEENKENTTRDQDGDERTDETPKPSTTKAAATVQTTLNISSKPSFSECKVCDTVWNPLYPDDEKYHRKRHAAVLRAKKRKSDELD